MAAVALEPRPTPARVFIRAVLHLSFRDAFAALLTTWRLAFQPTRPVRPALRAQSMALLLGVLVVVGLGGPFAASTGLGLLRSAPAPQPPAATMPAVVIDEATPSPQVIAIDASPRPETTPEPTPKAKTPRDDDRKTAKPKARPKATPKAVQDEAAGRPTRKAAEKEDREDREDKEDD